MSYVLPLAKLRMTDVATVGGKNASLGELISQLDKAGVRVPGGFATTAEAFGFVVGATRRHARSRRLVLEGRAMLGMLAVAALVFVAASRFFDTARLFLLALFDDRSRSNDWRNRLGFNRRTHRRLRDFFFASLLGLCLASSPICAASARSWIG